jgi:hypothetical protein
MKHEAILAERDGLQMDPGVESDFDVYVRWNEGEIEAQVLNVSADGFRLRTTDPLQVGSEVTLGTGKYDAVKAIICWACGLDAGGVFSEPVAL